MLGSEVMTQEVALWLPVQTPTCREATPGPCGFSQWEDGSACPSVLLP